MTGVTGYVNSSSLGKDYCCMRLFKDKQLSVKKVLKIDSLFVTGYKLIMPLFKKT